VQSTTCKSFTSLGRDKLLRARKARYTRGEKTSRAISSKREGEGGTEKKKGGKKGKLTGGRGWGNRVKKKKKSTGHNQKKKNQPNQR